MKFTEHFSNLDLLLQHNIINFYSAEEYPVLLFSFLLKDASSKIEVRFIDLKEQKIEDLVSEVNMSFLGSRILFWFSDISQLSERDSKAFYNLIKNYNGSNILVFYSKEKLSVQCQTAISILLDDIKSEIEFRSFAKLIFDPISRSLDFNIKKFFKKRQKFSLDQAFLLSYYGSTLGVASDEFLDSWFDAIIISQESIFNLTSLLFAKNREFIKAWHKIKDVYAPAFWTTFWSDQFFRAYWYVYYQNHKDFSNAKKISYKLPFSFINYDWKKVKLADLASAHNYFYNLDCDVKNNLSFVPESFFVSFLK